VPGVAGVPQGDRVACGSGGGKQVAVLVDSKIIVELTPGEACKLAGALTRLSTQAGVSQP
jgi:hypothetical protein